MARMMTTLAEKYQSNVQAEICTMYLGLVMGEIKSIVSCAEGFAVKWKHLKEVINDGYLQKTIVGYNYIAENFAKKILFWAIKRRKPGLCYALAWLRNLKG